jgi:hypothetical protein
MNQKKIFFTFFLSLPLLFLAATASIAEEQPTPSGTVSFNSTSIGVGVGVEWGNGTLTFNDQMYKFKITGVGIAGAGVSSVEAKGDVYDLKDVADFPGTYKGAGMGLTVAAGGDDLKVKNDKGVSMVIATRNTGISLNVGAGGMKIEMVE